jgi:hypothetical protein
MKQIWIGMLLAAVCIITAIGGLSGTAVAAPGPSFTISPNKTELKEGETATLRLAGENLHDLYSFEVVLTFDPLLLEFTGVQTDLQGFPVTPVVNGSKLTYSFTKTGNSTGEKGSVELSRFTFKSLAAGAAGIRLESVRTLNSQLSRSDTFTGNAIILSIIAKSGGGGTGDPGEGPGDPGEGHADPDEGPADPANGIGTVEASGDTTVLKIDQDRIQSVMQTDRNEIEIDLSSIGHTSVKVLEIPVTVLSGLREANKDMVILSGGVSMVLSKASLQLDGIKDTVRISIADSGRFGVAGAGFDAVTDTFDISIRAEDRDVKIAKPVEVTLQLGSLSDSRKIGVYYNNESTGEWEYEGGKVNKEKTAITFKARHFSQYAVLEYIVGFADVAIAHWAKDPIEVLASKHIIVGSDDGRFIPERKVTRAEFAAMAARLLELPEAEYNGEFTDVRPGDWYAGAVAAVSQAGVMLGDGSAMRPGDFITRQEMAVMAKRLHAKLGASGEAGEGLYGKAFADGGSIAQWALEAALYVQQAGIMNGKPGNLFAPFDSATRAEAAAIFYRLLDKSSGL